MNAQSQQLLQSALALSESDRADLAASLIQSLDTESDSEVESAWAAEIQRRIDSIDSGEATLIPWDVDSLRPVIDELRERS